MIRCIYPVVLAVIIGHVATAHGIIIREELTPDLGEVATPVVKDAVVDVSFPPGTAIADFSVGNSDYFEPLLVSSTKLRIFPQEGAVRSNVNVTLRDRREVTLSLAMKRGWAINASRVEFYEPGTMPRSLDRAESDLEIGKWLADAHTVDAPREIDWQRYGHDLTLRTGFVVHTKNAVLVPVALRTNGEPFPVAELQFADEQGRPVEAVLIYAEHDLLAKNFEVNRDQPLIAAFRVDKPHQIANGWSITAVPVGRLARAQFNWHERRQRGPLENKLAVAVYALGGMGSLDDGVGNDERAWALLQGGGAQVTFGIKRNISIQGAFDIAQSNRVVFDDAAWDQDQGQLLVDETASRLFASGLFHASRKRWIPYARLGLGVRLSKRELQLGSRCESEFRAGALVGFGGGVNVLLGKRMMAGLSVGYTAPIGGDDTGNGFDAGFALAGVWSTGTN